MELNMLQVIGVIICSIFLLVVIVYAFVNIVRALIKLQKRRMVLKTVKLKFTRVQLCTLLHKQGISYFSSMSDNELVTLFNSHNDVKVVEILPPEKIQGEK